MTPSGNPRSAGGAGGTGRGPWHHNLVERRMTRFLHEPPSVRLAASLIVTATAIVVVVGGVLMRVLDHAEYHSIWLGMWWVLQTVTTVGYGDVTPKATIGRIITSVIMLEGIALLSIVTAAITSVFVARAQRERDLGEDSAEATIAAGISRIDQHLQQLDERLDRLQAALERKTPES